MQRIAFALVFAVLASVRFASAAAISVAGADCGSDPLLGLTFTTVTGTNLPLVVNSSCPANNIGVGAIVTASDSAPLYGPSITSLDLTITNPNFGISDLEVLKGSAFADITSIGDGTFRLWGGAGIQITCLTDRPATDLGRCAPRDAVITFEGLPENTEFAVTAVNPVPEPATAALLLTGLSAAWVRRRARRTRA